MINVYELLLKVTYCATTQADGTSHRHRYRLYSTIPPTPF
ncbi:UNVERIFIED_CONTAM: hypothetical protein ABIC26_001991 [Paenibacillus sp. PvR008]